MTSACCPSQPTRPRRCSASIDAAYEKRSIAISSNIHPSGFDELMPKSIATATVDRLLHHAHVADHRRPGQLPARPSDRRQGGEAPDLTADSRALTVGRFVATSGEKTMATSGEIVAAVGEKPMAIDNPLRRTRVVSWPGVGRLRCRLTSAKGSQRHPSRSAPEPRQVGAGNATSGVVLPDVSPSCMPTLLRDRVNARSERRRLVGIEGQRSAAPSSEAPARRAAFRAALVRLG